MSWVRKFKTNDKISRVKPNRENKKKKNKKTNDQTNKPKRTMKEQGKQ